MRIAVIAPPWVPVPPPAYGGTELVLDGLCRGLADAGHDVLLYATGDSTCPVRRGSTFEIAPGTGAGGYALFLGRMAPEKGVHTAIRAARRAGIPLVIAAKMREQREHQYFSERVRPLLGGDVEYVGEVGGDAKLQLLADAACLLNPIDWPEPFGMVMIEALACGTPVVATPCGSTPEIVDDGVTGFLGSDEDSLAMAIGRVGDLDRGACRTAVEQRFSHRRMAADHLALYEVSPRRAGAARRDGTPRTSTLPRPRTNSGAVGRAR